jgi:serine/threonine protein kinase
LLFLHDKNVEHRDVTCVNFFLTQDENLKLADFTGGRIATSLEDMETGEKGDIFEFGRAGYEMATGIRPNSNLTLDE